jgi:hypothetical protein
VQWVRSSEATKGKRHDVTKVERDSTGIPVDDTLRPALRQIRQEEEKNAQARADMTLRRMRRRTEEIRKAHLDQIQREEEARRDLEEHQRRLADEIDQAMARTQPNPWLRPWDPGYESPTLLAPAAGNGRTLG